MKNALSVESALLVGLCIVLPLLEAPKHLFWLAYIAVWLANRVRAHDFGGPWDLWDTLIALWIGSGLLSTLFAGLPGSGRRGFRGPVAYTRMLLMGERTPEL